MLSINARRSLDTWNNHRISPGVVGSVGDANVNVTFKSTFPGDYREAPYTAGNTEMRLGSNVQDGDRPSFDTGSMQARTIGGFFGGDRDSLTTQRGWVFQNIKLEDMVEEPVMGALPRYKWRNQVATINNAATTGNKFAVLPNGYQPGPGAIPRGGQKPGVVSKEGDAGGPSYASGGSIATEAVKTPYMHPVPRIGLSQKGKSNNGGISVGTS